MNVYKPRRIPHTMADVISIIHLLPQNVESMQGEELPFEPIICSLSPQEGVLGYRLAFPLQDHFWSSHLHNPLKRVTRHSEEIRGHYMFTLDKIFAGEVFHHDTPAYGRFSGLGSIVLHTPPKGYRKPIGWQHEGKVEINYTEHATKDPAILLLLEYNRLLNK